MLAGLVDDTDIYIDPTGYVTFKKSFAILSIVSFASSAVDTAFDAFVDAVSAVVFAAFAVVFAVSAVDFAVFAVDTAFDAFVDAVSAVVFAAFAVDTAFDAFVDAVSAVVFAVSAVDFAVFAVDSALDAMFLVVVFSSIAAIVLTTFVIAPPDMENVHNAYSYTLFVVSAVRAYVSSCVNDIAASDDAVLTTREQFAVSFGRYVSIRAQTTPTYPFLISTSTLSPPVSISFKRPCIRNAPLPIVITLLDTLTESSSPYPL
jgi:hypothetical protein